MSTISQPLVYSSETPLQRILIPLKTEYKQMCFEDLRSSSKMTFFPIQVGTKTIQITLGNAYYPNTPQEQRCTTGCAVFKEGNRTIAGCASTLEAIGKQLATIADSQLIVDI